MSTIQKEQGNPAGILEKDEALKLLKENCKNFLKMSQEEKSEGLKINYLLGIIKLSDNLQIDSETFITTIFDEILFIDLNNLKSRNIFSNFITILESKNVPQLFERKFFSLLNKFGSEYNINSIYFHQYLIDISLYYIFNSSFKCQEKTDYISMIIENDIKPFETQLLKNILNKHKKLIDENENKIIMSKHLFSKFISMNKYKSCLILFTKILENLNNNYKKIPKEIIFQLIKSTNDVGFNHVIKKTKEINDFLIFNCLLLDNLDEKLFVSEEELELFDIYLINLLNLLSIKKDLNIDIFQKIFSYYNARKYKNLNKIFPDVLYYLSTYSYYNPQYEFLFNCINSTLINPIYSKLIANHLLSLNKKPVDYKENSSNKYKNTKFNIVEDNLNTDLLIDDNLFLFNNNNNLSFLNHLCLYSYIINSSFSISKSFGSRATINFYPKILNRILVLLNNLSLENSNKKKYFEEFLLFLLDLFTIIINFYLSINEFIFKDEDLIMSFIKIIDKSSQDNKYLIVFPSLINIIKTSLLNSSNYLSGNSNEKKLYNLIFDCLIANFSNITNTSIFNNYQQIILIYKSLIILFNDRSTTNIQKNFFCLDKLIDLALKSNNKDTKVFESFYKLCHELLKSPDEINKTLSNYSLNRYSKFINNYLNDSFCDYIIEKFNEIFIQKRPNNIAFDDNTYFVINTISNIYNNDKIQNESAINKLNEEINGFCGSKLIIGVIDNLFFSIEKEECDIIKVINNDNDMYSKYNKLNKTLNDLEFYIYIYDNYFDKNIQINKKSMCHYGILKSLAHLLSGYLSNAINSLLKDQEASKDEEKVIFLLEYIKKSILLNKSLVKTSYPIFFLNHVFKDKIIVHYFMVHYTDYIINKLIKENNTNQNNAVQLAVGEITNKNIAFIDCIHQNSYFILFMKDIINSFIEFETSMLNPNKNSLKKNSPKNKLLKCENIIYKLNEHGDRSLSECNENQKIMINSFFNKMLLNQIYEKNNPQITFENNQIIFLFLLDNAILEKYFDLFGYFINIDYTLIQLYSIMRKSNISIELNEKYIHFINKYIQIDNISNYILRILNNKKTFDKLFKCNNINKKYVFDLYNILENVMINLTNYIGEINDNGIHGGNIINLFNEILDHINNSYAFNFNFSNTELCQCGKIIKNIIKNLSKSLISSKGNNKDNTNNILENNKSNVSDKISATLEQIYSTILPKYINIYYKTISSLFDDKDRKLNLDYTLDNVFLSFYTLIDIISGAKDNEKYYKTLSEKVEPEKMNFFSNLLSFNEFNDYLISNNFYITFKEKYSNFSEGITYKRFLQNLFLFLLFKGKNDEKNLKSVIILIFNEFKDIQSNEDFIKFGYLIWYFLNSVKKDNNNRKNSNTSMNFGDYSIISSIGERFKEDEKSLQKKNTNPVNLNK